MDDPLVIYRSPRTRVSLAKSMSVKVPFEPLMRRALRHGVAWSLLAIGISGLIAGGCGRRCVKWDEDRRRITLLRWCSDQCGDGLDCISGLCTRACITNQADACAMLPKAACTADSIEPGAVAICDVACETASDCVALSGEHGCQDGFCRASALSLGTAGGDGAGGAASGMGGSAVEPVDCSAYRNQPGSTEIAVVIRNERSTPLYVLPFQECNDPAASLVSFERDAQPVNVRGFGTCDSRSCEDIQDNGSREPLPCPGACQQSPFLVRLEPGAELDVGRFWNEFVSHGILNSTQRMPNACYSGYMDPQLLPGMECFAQTPLPEAEYLVGARAFTGLQCNSDVSCDCAPGSSGSCVTSSQFGAGNETSASTTLALPASSVTVTFRNE